MDLIVNVSVRTGPGDDAIGFTSALVEGNLRIDTGGGNGQALRNERAGLTSAQLRREGARTG